MHGIFYYSSISGNTALIGEALQGHFKDAGITLELQNVLGNSVWQPADFVILGCGTYGHGQLEKNIRYCVENLWKDVQLNGIPCAAVGLGDHRYDLEYNMYAADIFEAWLREHGGNIITPALRINRSPVKSTNVALVESWAKNLHTQIASLLS